jgi:beta-galactosidase
VGVAPCGGRQEIDYTHPAFLFHAERVIRKIVARYADHPAVIGYQVDNEPGMLLSQAVQIRSGGNVNDLTGELHGLMDRISLSDIVTEKTAESHAIVDIVGHNYAAARYLADQAEFPNRVVVGTETLAKQIDVNWKLVEDNPHVIGDFTLTGWDYLGEATLGRTTYVGDGAENSGPDFPWLLAWCGDNDITGYRRPSSYYREIVFGLRHEP